MHLRKMMLAAVTLSQLCFGVLSVAQSCTLELKGKVLDANTQKPLAYATILIKGSSQGAITDDSGTFLIDHLCAGSYTVSCSMIGHDPVDFQIVLNENRVQDFQLETSAVALEQVIVKEKAIAPVSTQANSTLQGTDLESGKAQGLGEALKRLPGVTTLNTGHSISKPVIQGLNGNRIVILNNGVRLEAQQWGDEHAPEIDPFIASKVSVVKGAAGVRYGSEAIGGVVLVEPKALREKAGLGGEVNLGAASNGRSGVVSASIEGALGGKLPLSARLQGTFKRGGNVHTPDYFQRNTGLQEFNYSWAVQLKKEKFSTALYYSIFSTQLGILRDAHIGNLTDLENAIERGRPLQDGEFSYEIGRPKQQVIHELFKWQLSLDVGEKSKLQVEAARQFNRRQEFDAHRPFGNLPDELTRPQFEFEITTYTTDVNLDHRWLPNTRGSIGVQGLLQQNTTDFGALIPNYTSRAGGVYWLERWRKYPSPWELEAGVRYDAKQLSLSTQGTDTIGRALRFSNFSGTAGAVYHFPQGTLRFNAGTAWRAPHPNELYSDGVHHGAAAYELGDPNLRAERALNVALSANWEKPDRFSISVSIYQNYIADFIYLEPQDVPKLTIRGAFPAFNYRQANVRLSGIDWNAELFLRPKLSVESRAAILRAWNRDANDYLIYMPSDRFTHGLKYSFRKPKDAALQAPFMRFSMTNVLRQNRVPEGDLVPPPAGYTRFDLEAAMSLRLGTKPLELGLSVFNLFNARYRDYLNRFRYFTDELGTNIALRAKIIFD